MEKPDDIVGHKTFDTGERNPATGFPMMRHEPLTRAEGEALWRACEEAKAKREADMPDERAALQVLSGAYTRLTELGWRDAIYCPKDGSLFKVIEAGSTGVHDGSYNGEWPKGSWWVHDDHDTWPSHPILFRLYPEDQKKYDERMQEAKAQYAAICEEPET